MNWAVSRGYLTLVTFQARISFGSSVLFVAVYRFCNFYASENELPVRPRLCSTREKCKFIGRTFILIVDILRHGVAKTMGNTE